MTPVFNEFGQPNAEMLALGNELELMTRELLERMVHLGYTATDIRAASGYLTGCAEISGSHAILTLQAKIHNDRVRNADPNPLAEEMDLLRQDLYGNKIRVIKMYRERTGVGLREAKDMVESWMKTL